MSSFKSSSELNARGKKNNLNEIKKIKKNKSASRIRDEECNTSQIYHWREEQMSICGALLCLWFSDSRTCVFVGAQRMKRDWLVCVCVCHSRACICAILHRNRSFSDDGCWCLFSSLLLLIYVIRMRNDWPPKVCMNKTVLRDVENSVQFFFVQADFFPSVQYGGEKKS